MTLAIIDDHLIFAESLKKILSDFPEINNVEIYECADAFIEKIPVYPPDIIITDLVMPGTNNGMRLIEFCIQQYAPKPKIIVLSSISDVQTIKKAIRIGASGFLSKNINTEELITAITEICENKQYISKDLRETLLNTLFTEEQIIYHLSPREKEVLQNVCKGLTIKEIAYNLKLSTHTVQYYHKNVLNKLKLKRTSDLIVFAMKHGLYIPDID